MEETKGLSHTSSLSQLKQVTTKATEFLSQHHGIYESNCISLFADELLASLPKDWQEYLLELNEEQIKALPCARLRKSALHSPPPPTLQQFFDTAESLTLPFELDATNKDSAYTLSGFNDMSMFEGKLLSKESLPFDHHLLHKMSAKKVHEVIRLSYLVDQVCKASGVESVVDIGAGEGYVSHVLAHHFGYRVIAIEGNASHMQKGVARVQKANQNMQASTQEGEKKPREPYFMTYLLTDESILGFEDKIQEAIRICKDKEKEDGSQEVLSSDGPEKFCVIGLHTCGDLAMQVIDLFCKVPSAASIVGIGCCYYNIMPPFEDDPTRIYPRSKHLKENEFRVSLNGLKLATGNPLQFSKADPKYFKKSSKALTYRATMEVVIRQHYPADEFPHTNYRIKRVSISSHANEETYIRHALGKRFCCKPKGSPFLSFMTALVPEAATPEKLENWKTVKDGPLVCFNVDPKDSEEIKKQKEEKQKELLPKILDTFAHYAKRAREVIIWEAVLLVLGQVVESLILRDRLLYIGERLEEASIVFGDEHLQLIPVFDATISPRTMAVIALKEKKHV